MNLAERLLRLMGWTVHITVPDYPKAIICVAPHTSNLDFFIGKLAYGSVGRKAGFMMKSFWFFPPLGWILKSMGGIPVNRNRSTSLVDNVIAKFNSSDRLSIAITPEGTRKRNTKWHTGFLRIAFGAKVPILLGVLDFGTKTVSITTTFIPTGNIEEDMKAIKSFYRSSNAVGKFPDKFCAD